MINARHELQQAQVIDPRRADGDRDQQQTHTEPVETVKKSDDCKDGREHRYGRNHDDKHIDSSLNQIYLFTFVHDQIQTEIKLRIQAQVDGGVGGHGTQQKWACQRIGTMVMAVP